MTTGRDRVWALALEIARARHDRGWLREFGPETVAAVADERDVDVSTRTIRRVLDAMADLGVLLDVGTDGERCYRLRSRTSSTDVANNERSQEAATDLSVPSWSADPATDLSQSSRESADTSVSNDRVRGRRRAVDTSVTGPTSPFDGERLIYHLFADTGVESEPLSAYGEVIRVGLDPQETAFSHAIQADATRPPLDDRADLVVLHPPCQRWSTATRLTGTQDDHPDLLDEARDLGKQLGEHYVIENVPEAPLEDPVVLRGEMFGLPIPYARAFETSFDVPEPPAQATIDGFARPFETDDGSLGVFRGEKAFWRTVKQVSGDYPAKPLKHSGIPAPYVHYLAHWWLRAIDGGDGS